ncbi:substrate-binding domain-containing protein [Actinokineospora sp. NBRC 105648]|uniref:substrate-binding domain-containing protein n=1 Tax=Actinokineospora sp. NBRC 105648 TaxID=3032206 RepID=UPI0024A0881A|nr:substrate-binding domain-containing protein [Actinokineospora sp. NBRC 105648]GLZ38007.1 phosphate-binding protein [Actinokineospora sp. NBRC 105648]
MNQSVPVLRTVHQLADTTSLTDPQVVIGAVSAVLTIVISLAAWWARRKRISWRVHLDTPIGRTPTLGENMIDVELRDSRRGGAPVPDASLALIRIMNTGSAAIGVADFETPLHLEFGGRRVIDVDVVEAKPPVLRMLKALEEAKSWPPVGQDKLDLPKLPFNSGDRVKLLVLLSGDPAGDGAAVDCDGILHGGEVVHDTTRGDGPSKRTMWLRAGMAVVLTASAALIVSGLTSGSDSHCVAGTIGVEGSSAFAPVAAALAEEYTRQCSAAHINVKATSSDSGVIKLNSTGGTGELTIAMSDGEAIDSYPWLSGRQVGNVTFAVVLNNQVQVTNLARQEIKDLYNGNRTAWPSGQQVHLVSRDYHSGTRAAFDHRVLDGSEPNPTSHNCQDRDPGADGTVLLCEMSSADDVLNRVAGIDGALGYVEVTKAAEEKGLHTVSIDGISPAPGGDRSHYPFQAAEILYTYGQPAADSLTAAFLRFVDGETGKKIITDMHFGTA